MLYGQHANLERMTGLALVLQEYGDVTIPDLPGFGGMQSFYTINKKPTLDNFADYVATFIKTHYKADQQITFVAMSFSFLVVTRMLQKHPELSERIKLLVSFVGFLHKDDFHVAKPYWWSWWSIATIFGSSIGAAIWRYGILQPAFIRFAYGLVARIHPKMSDADAAERRRRIDFEITLWHCNDVRTRMQTLKVMLTANVCTARVPLPVYHIAVADDFYFDNQSVAKHMEMVYTSFESIPAEGGAHAPTIIATAEQAAPFIPHRVRELLSDS